MHACRHVVIQLFRLAQSTVEPVCAALQLLVCMLNEVRAHLHTTLEWLLRLKDATTAMGSVPRESSGLVAVEGGGRGSSSGALLLVSATNDLHSEHDVLG